MRNVPITPRRPSVLEPERSGPWTTVTRRTPSVDGQVARPAITLQSPPQTLPYICLSVSGRKLAPSAPPLKGVSRTESGELASGWHDSSPFRALRDLHENAPLHAANPGNCSSHNDVGDFLREG